MGDRGAFDKLAAVAADRRLGHSPFGNGQAPAAAAQDGGEFPGGRAWSQGQVRGGATAGGGEFRSARRGAAADRRLEVRAPRDGP